MVSITEAYITNRSFVGNVQQSYYGGGLINTESSTIITNQSNLNVNRATISGRGGAIYATHSTIIIDQPTFSDTRSTASGMTYDHGEHGHEGPYTLSPLHPSSLTDQYCILDMETPYYMPNGYS